MAALDAYYRVYEMPWALSSEQEQQFKKLLMRCIGAVLILTILFTILPTPEPDPAEIQEIPKRFAKLMLERKMPARRRPRCERSLNLRPSRRRLFRRRWCSPSRWSSQK